MIELQGLQHLGYAVFAIVIAYSVWIAVLFEKNRKHQHTIMSLLEKLQGFENEVDQYRATVKEQMLLIYRMNQEIANLKLEPLTLEKAYKEAMNLLKLSDKKNDLIFDLAWALNMEIECYEILVDGIIEDVAKKIIAHVGHVPSTKWRQFVSELNEEENK